MSANFYIDIADNRPPLIQRLRTAQGTAVDLTTVETITLRFRIRLPGGARGNTFTRTGEVYGDDPALGIIEYQWTIGDFTGNPPPFVAGTYDLKTNILFTDGGSLTVPTLEPSALYVSDSLSL